MAIQAIETRYAGHLFRSRLEARWAVFFDALRIEWQYEPQGFETSDGERYLPDFYLPKHGRWCEIKGDPEGMRNDFERLSVVLPSLLADSDKKLLLLGEIPRERRRPIAHPVIAWDRDMHLYRDWFVFVPLKPSDGCPLASPYSTYADRTILGGMLGLSGSTHMEHIRESPGWRVESKVLPIDVSSTGPVGEAYSKAAEARFEHGQSGAR